MKKVEKLTRFFALRHSAGFSPKNFWLRMTERNAFTLAEVLITLGIIGVVAAVTMPTLVKNYQEKAWSTGSQVFQSKFINALRTMNTQGTLAGLQTTEAFVAELGKNMKIIKTCDNNSLNECMSLELATVIDYDQGGKLIPSDASSVLKTAQNFGLDWGTNVVGFVLASGQAALVTYNPNCVEDTYNNQFVPTSCVAGIYDVNGLSNPNTLNKDIRYYGSVSINGGGALKFGGKLWKTPVYATGVSYNQCMTAGLTAYCPTAEVTNYYAGAVIACGGKQNMPTAADFSSFSQYNPMSTLPFKETFPICESLSGGHVRIWLNGEETKVSSSTRGPIYEWYGTSSSYSNNAGVDAVRTLTICKAQ